MSISDSILIVEDEAISAMTLKLKLEKDNFNVCGIASTGAKAIEFSKKHNPGLVIMDIRIAGEINGIETAKAIKEIDDCSIIFMTGYNEENLKKEADKLNPAAYLIKPVKIENLKKILYEFYNA